MTSFLKRKGLLLSLVIVAIIAISTVYTNASTQTAQVQDFSFSATVDCNFHTIEEISTNGIKALSIYYYPVEFLAESITCDNDGTVILHNVFLYKHTRRNIYGQAHTEYFDPAEHPENFLQSVIIYPQSQVVIKKNHKDK